MVSTVKRRSPRAAIGVTWSALSAIGAVIAHVADVADVAASAVYSSGVVVGCCCRCVIAIAASTVKTVSTLVAECALITRPSSMITSSLHVSFAVLAADVLVVCRRQLGRILLLTFGGWFCLQCFLVFQGDELSSDNVHQGGRQRRLLFGDVVDNDNDVVVNDNERGENDDLSHFSIRNLSFVVGQNPWS